MSRLQVDELGPGRGLYAPTLVASDETEFDRQLAWREPVVSLGGGRRGGKCLAVAVAVEAPIGADAAGALALGSLSEHPGEDCVCAVVGADQVRDAEVVDRAVITETEVERWWGVAGNVQVEPAAESSAVIDQRVVGRAGGRRDRDDAISARDRGQRPG